MQIETITVDYYNKYYSTSTKELEDWRKLYREMQTDNRKTIRIDIWVVGLTYPFNIVVDGFTMWEMVSFLYEKKSDE